MDQTGTKALLISRLISKVEKESQTADVAPWTQPEKKGPDSEQKVEGTSNEDHGEVADAVRGEEDGEIKPKHVPIVYSALQKDDNKMKSDEEAKKRKRAERFGIVRSMLFLFELFCQVDAVDDEAKKMKLRGERFNLKPVESEAAKMEQRAQRFSKSLSDTEEKGTKRAIDLSHIVTQSTVTEEEKKRRRAERFGKTKN